VVATPEGQATGLVQDSVVTCLQLATISEDRIAGIIGKLSAAMLVKLNDCLKAALEIP
jgi:mRNA interferase MazF